MSALKGDRNNQKHNISIGKNHIEYGFKVYNYHRVFYKTNTGLVLSGNKCLIINWTKDKCERQVDCFKLKLAILLTLCKTKRCYLWLKKRCMHSVFWILGDIQMIFVHCTTYIVTKSKKISTCLIIMLFNRVYTLSFLYLHRLIIDLNSNTSKDL